MPAGIMQRHRSITVSFFSFLRLSSLYARPTAIIIAAAIITPYQYMSFPKRLNATLLGIFIGIILLLCKKLFHRSLYTTIYYGAMPPISTSVSGAAESCLLK